eukprot:TRINITY_DN2974_c0_g1_i1.p1 TRINITY_DN2974_c0_g1~~TRINITY_DN2974_c0_g1_i1.p1  ORF type:complete len:324 (+),score=45.18 TRINITY_DN2974_c0_g1_i1:45-1016(+)
MAANRLQIITQQAKASALPDSFSISDEVTEALHSGKAVVALESTIISHGMPFPENIRTAERVEAEVRRHGAIPATICILGGTIHVGVNAAQLQQLGDPKTKVIKCTTRDLPLAVSKKLNGSTTVAATMAIAHHAGIRVFVTGGIGGVHRGVYQTWDISADITELGRTPVAVVSAGIKSILDIPKTLEALETQGVPVVTLGSDEFPAFFTATSGCPTPTRLDTPAECARLIHQAASLGLLTGTLITVPIPAEHAADGAIVEKATTAALQEAGERHVSGHDITPFLLKRIHELTSGASLKSNIALVLNNARVGATIAVELAALQR